MVSVSKATMKRWLALLLLAVALPVWAGLSARIDRAQLRVGESFQLLIEKEGRYSGAGPDLSPLDRDFDLLGNARSSQINIVNGEMDASTRWTITLAPKRDGTLSVPPIELDGDWTPSFPVQVGSAAAPSGGAGKQQPGVGGGELFVEVEATPEAPYLQAQLTYRVRIFRTIDFGNASLSDPEVAGAVIERLGDDLSYNATRDGRRYQVIERRYAIFPQRSGPLKIVGPVLNAEIAERERGGWRDPFQGLFSRTRPVQIKGEDRTVEVRSARGGGEWLPAEGLTLKEEWSPENPQWRVGEPVTRILTLEARGLTGAQLPPIHRPPEGAVSGYPDQPSIENEVDGESMVGRRVERIALVPGRPGPITLPEIRVRWWDTAADRSREAVIPARTVQVVAAEGGSASTPLPESMPSVSADAAPAEPSAPLAAPMVAGGAESPYWRWAALLFAALWLLTAALWRLQARRVGSGAVARTAVPAEPVVGAGEARKRLRQACRANDAEGARAALLAWGAARWPDRPPFSLGALAERLDEGPAADALRALDRSLYHPEEGAWIGRECLERLDTALKGGEDSAPREQSLPALYQ